MYVISRSTNADTYNQVSQFMRSMPDFDKTWLAEWQKLITLTTKSRGSKEFLCRNLKGKHIFKY